MMWANALNYVYITMVVILSVYGAHAIILTVLYLMRHRTPPLEKCTPDEWPMVCVQLPLYNEQSVADRMIDAVCAFDYPRDRLTIQILDDSTDMTTEMAQLRVDRYCAQGFHIELFHRDERTGFKAGALAEAMEATNNAEFIAIFDADFLPAPNFLKTVIPHFYADPKIGMVQTRWGHSNRDTNILTRTQALFLDGHQVVEQVARSRSGLLLNFNGSGGIWRAECISDCGGWQWDTLSEDIDISYRAQLKHWRMVFLPDIIVPAEVPLTMTNFKKQQNRWTFGHIQVFRKLIGRIWTAPGLTLAQRIGGTFHLSANFMQIAALLMFLLTVPLALLHPKTPSALGVISLATTGPTILFAVSQIFGYHDGVRRGIDRLIHLPILVLVAIGLTVSNVGAVLGVFAGRKMVWSVTPKNTKRQYAGLHHSVPATVWIEIALSIYCAIGLSLALRHAPDLIPLAALGMLSYGYVGCSSLVESNRPKKTSSVKIEMVEQ